MTHRIKPRLHIRNAHPYGYFCEELRALPGGSWVIVSSAHGKTRFKAIANWHDMQADIYAFAH